MHYGGIIVIALCVLSTACRYDREKIGSYADPAGRGGAVDGPCSGDACDARCERDECSSSCTDGGCRDAMVHDAMVHDAMVHDAMVHDAMVRDAPTDAGDSGEPDADANTEPPDPDPDPTDCPLGQSRNDGGGCVSVDPCAPFQCPANSACVAGDGLVSCVCDEGFETVAVACQDTDECSPVSPCDARAWCRNTIGSFACACPSYFTSEDGGRQCRDERYRWHVALTGEGVQIIPNRNGDVFVIATFRGGTAFAEASYASNGATDLLIAKLSSDGEPAWVRQLGGPGEEYSIYAATDPAGDLVITGRTGGGFDMGAGWIDTGGQSSRYVAKLGRTDGACQWNVLMPNAIVETTEVDWWQTVAVDAAANVLVSGKLFTHLDVGDIRLTSAGGADVYLVKLSSTGEVSWAKSWGSTGDDSSHGVAVDPQGNPFVLASFNHTLSLGGDVFTARGSYDAAIVKLDPDGQHIWSKQYGGVSYDLPGRLTADTAGNAVIGGHFWNVMTIGEHELTTRGEWDAYVAKVDPQGDVAWVLQLGGPATEHAWGMATDAEGNVLVSGITDGPLDFGEGERELIGDNDAFVLKLASNGDHIWSHRFGGSGWDTSAFVSTGPDLTVYTAGVMAPPVSFDGTPETRGNQYALKLGP